MNDEPVYPSTRFLVFIAVAGLLLLVSGYAIGVLSTHEESDGGIVEITPAVCIDALHAADRLNESNAQARHRAGDVLAYFGEAGQIDVDDLTGMLARVGEAGAQVRARTAPFERTAQLCRDSAP